MVTVHGKYISKLECSKMHKKDHEFHDWVQELENGNKCLEDD